MIQFNDISLETFLSEYWQKKPILLRNAVPNFQPPITPEEMAGLSLEEEVESRIVIQHSEIDYELKRGPFSEADYAQLPESHWTLLVQGMDRLMDSVTDLLDEFTFIPRWRIDDIMVSYATTGGNVGPHYDHYDVFLLQGAGQREWKLSSQGCTPENYIEGVDLRLMKSYQVEDTYLCQPGDVLYIPPKWGHHGVSLDDACMTFSIGYRSYRGLELWDSFGDYLAENEAFQRLYQDPNWSKNEAGQVSDAAWQNAKMLLQSALEDDQALKQWFGRFATQLDESLASQLPDPLTEEEKPELGDLIDALQQSEGILRHPACRFAYTELAEDQVLLNINGAIWPSFGAEVGLIKMLCNQRFIERAALNIILEHEGNQLLLKDLWEMQFFEII